MLLSCNIAIGVYVDVCRPRSLSLYQTFFLDQAVESSDSKEVILRLAETSQQPPELP